MSNGLNLLHPRKDVAEMVIVFCVSLIVPEDLMLAIKSGEHVYQESSFFVSPLSFLRVSWWYQVSMSWCNCSKMSEVLAGAHINWLAGFLNHQQYHIWNASFCWIPWDDYKPTNGGSSQATPRCPTRRPMTFLVAPEFPGINTNVAT